MTLSTQTKRRPSSTIHYKKRYGQHRRQTKPYLKTYWPYLPLLGIGAVVIVLLGARFMGAPGAVLGSITVSIGVFSILI